MNPSDTKPSRTQALEETISIMARLRAADGCPWDREQTFDSIKAHTLEETYEVFDAIDRRAWPELKDELGDLLLQVLFYAQMAEEAGYFSIEDVAASLRAKLIRRHPHIFGDAVASTPDEVDRTWEAVKRQEQAARSQVDEHHLDAVRSYLPALLEAQKLGARAAKVGFDWPDRDGLFAKLLEEAAELREEIERTRPVQERVADEVGDLLFTSVQLARHLHVEPEFALRGTNRKFRKRFNAMEDAANGVDALSRAGAEELDQRWREAKAATTKL